MTGRTRRTSIRATAWCCASALVWAACESHEPEAHDDHDDHKAEHSAHKHYEATDPSVEIDRAMLRDLRITTAPAESRPVGDTVAVLGELRVNEDTYAEIGSPCSARVSRVLAAPGDHVVAGQILVELESADVGRARAALTSTAAKLVQAEQTLARRRSLSADQIVPRRELEASETELAVTRAEHAAAQQALASVGATRGTGARFVLSTPVEGTVIDRTALRGRMVDAEHTLFVVGDLRRLWLVVHAFERDALRMHTETTANVLFPALPGQRFTGSVTRIGQRVDETSRTVDVRIDIDNPSGVLRPGMSASANVPIGDATATVVTVPVEAIQRHPRGWCVFIPGAQEGRFEMREVGRGRDLGGEVEVLSGLRAGERVVVDGAFLLKAEADKARGGGTDDEHHHH
jgi:cobalt-zinc-cadmium efflux system membrane fusion protein